VQETEREDALRLRRQMRSRSLSQRAGEEVLRLARKGFARIAELSPTRMNLSWVTPSLAVGGRIHTRDIPRLRQMGITAVVDCREEASDDELAMARNDIEFLRLPTPDAHTLTQESLDRGVSWVRERMVQGGKIYIHCSHGVGRAPELGACVLVADGLLPGRALELIRARRWQALPNEEQVLGLVAFADRHVGRKPTAEAPPDVAKEPSAGSGEASHSGA
jgi:protein-tyrosine phosphatase